MRHLLVFLTAIALLTSTLRAAPINKNTKPYAKENLIRQIEEGEELLNNVENELARMKRVEVGKKIVFYPLSIAKWTSLIGSLGYFSFATFAYFKGFYKVFFFLKKSNPDLASDYFKHKVGSESHELSKIGLRNGFILLSIGVGLKMLMEKALPLTKKDFELAEEEKLKLERAIRELKDQMRMLRDQLSMIIIEEEVSRKNLQMEQLYEEKELDGESSPEQLELFQNREFSPEKSPEVFPEKLPEALEER